jgi:O-antigen ligase
VQSTLTLPVRPRRRTVLAEHAPRVVGVVCVALVCLPILHPNGPLHATLADVLMVASIVVVGLWASRRHTPLHLPYGVAAGLYITAGFVAALFSVVTTLGLVAVGQDVFLLLWAAAIANLIRVPEHLDTLLAAWVYGAIAWATLLVGAEATGLGWLAGGVKFGMRAQMWFDNPNMAGNYFMLSLFVLMVSRHPRRPLVRAGAFALLAVAVLLTGSMAALGAFVIGTAVAWAYSTWRRNDLVTAIAGLGVAVIVVSTVGIVALRAGGFSSIESSSNTLVETSVGRASRSAAGRTSLFAHEVELFQHGTLIGNGPASTKTYMALTFNDVVKEAHDDYLATLTERGFFGMAGLLMIMLVVGLRATAIARARLAPNYAPLIHTPSAFIGAGVALAISSITHEILHYRHVWAFLGILGGVYLFGRARRSERHRTWAPS